MSREIRTPTLNSPEIIDIIYNEFLIDKPKIKYIKIWIKFYDKDNDLLSPYFFFKTKQYNCRYKLFNYFNGSYRNFKEKNLNKADIALYVINIDIIF
jgi:hypothetical protein